MIVKQDITYSYVAIDGEQFTSKADCMKYEDNLPRHLRYCLEKKISAADLCSTEDFNFEVGYSVIETHHGYESPAFLREGGEYSYKTSQDVILKRWNAICLMS